ncbi:MAG: terminase small subunit [Gammaproteobacteria bacterium]
MVFALQIPSRYYPCPPNPWNSISATLAMHEPVKCARVGQHTTQPGRRCKAQSAPARRNRVLRSSQAASHVLCPLQAGRFALCAVREELRALSLVRHSRNFVLWAVPIGKISLIASTLRTAPMGCRNSRGLTLRQARFVREYLVDGNGAQAAIRAGYGPRAAKEAAYKLVTTVHVKAEIERLARQEAGESGVSRSTILSELMNAFDLAKAKSNPSLMIAAMGEMAKILGYYPPRGAKARKPPKRGNAAFAFAFDALSDVELIALASGRAMSSW